MMSRLFITTCIFLWLGMVYVMGQDNSYHYGLSVMPQYNFPRFTKLEKNDDASSFSINAQFDVNYEICELIQLESGINFSKYRISKIDYSPRLPCDISTDGAIPFNSWFEDRYDIVYLGIPLSIKRRFPADENHFHIRVGAELLLKVSESKQTLLISKCGGTIELDPNIFNPLSSNVLVGQLAIGYEMAINNINTLLIEPQLSYSLTSHFDENSLVQDVTNNLGITGIGLRVGIRY